MALRDESGRRVRTIVAQRRPSGLSGEGVAAFTASVPLADMAPGRYVIHVEAQTDTGAKTTASRNVLIRVR
ncbi:MAG TPA: hypothetical protein VG871_05235 [Vicinamibacterales bacterium]|nr:hypothetical protein [Vicinamibacterales bacterium]